MIRLILPFLLMTSIFAGVGDIAGGTDKFQKGSQIHFQQFSTWVNVLYSKSLCQTEFNYEALISKCVKWTRDDGRKCIKRVKFEATQPKESSRQRCKRFEDDTCVDWEEVDFIQSPKRIVEIKDQDDNVIETRKVIVPRCH